MSNNIPDWCERPLDSRAHKGGEEGLNDKRYKGGEFLPFYVPRDVMPQIDDALYPKLIQFGQVHGVVFETKQIEPHVLKPHQHIDKLKANHIAALPEVFNKPVLVSVDDYILDGNHRWLSHLLVNKPVNTYQINRTFEDAILFLFKFPGTYYYGDGVKHAITS